MTTTITTDPTISENLATLERLLLLGRDPTVMIHGVSSDDMVALLSDGTLESVKRAVNDRGPYLVGRATIDGFDLGRFEVTLFTDSVSPA